MLRYPCLFSPSSAKHIVVSPSGSKLYSTVKNVGLPLQNISGNYQAVGQEGTGFKSQAQRWEEQMEDSLEAGCQRGHLQPGLSLADMIEEHLAVLVCAFFLLQAQQGSLAIACAFRCCTLRDCRENKMWTREWLYKC